MFDYQKAFGSPCITVTEEIFYNIISSSVVAEAITTCRHYQRRIDELPNLKSEEQFAKAKEWERLKQNAKKRLPGIMFQATFLPTTAKSGRYGKWRKNAAAVLNGLFILDIDHLSQDYITTIVNRCGKLIADKTIMMIFLTASGHGLKIVAKADYRRGNIEANQRWLAEQLQIKFDTACKDAARISFCPMQEDIYYIDNEIFTYNNEDFEKYYGAGYRDGTLNSSILPFDNNNVAGGDAAASNDVPAAQAVQPNGNNRPEAGGDSVQFGDDVHGTSASNGVQQADRARQSVGQTVSDYPKEYKGIDYKCIVDKYVELVGAPEVGGRHQWLLRMAKDLRYICDFKPGFVKEVMMLCATARAIKDERGEDEIKKICDAACSYRFYSGYPKTMREVFRICGIDVNKSDNSETPKEKVLIDYDYWWQRLAPLLEQGDAYTDAVAKIPDKSKLGGVLAAGAMYGTYMSRCMFPFYDGKNYKLSYIVYIIGHAASGKSFIIDMDKEIMESIKRQDEQYRLMEREYKEQKERMAASSKDAKEKAPQRPHYPIRYVPSTISNAKLYARLQDATDLEDESLHLHLFTLESELATALRVQVGSWAGKLDLELKSFQNEYAGVDYANELSANGLIQVNWNQVISGTMDALKRKMRGGTITDGYITRMALWIMPNSEYTMIEKKYDSVEMDSPEEQARKSRIKTRSIALDQLRGVINGTRQLSDYCYDWCANQCKQAELEEDACIEYFRKRIPIYMMRYTLPRVVCRQLDKFENGYLKEGQQLEILQSDLDFAGLIGDYLMFISIYQWGEQYLEFTQEEKQSLNPRKRKSAFAERYYQLPQEFTFADMRKYYSSDGATRRAISTLVTSKCAEKVADDKWKKIVTSIDDVVLR